MTLPRHLALFTLLPLAALAASACDEVIQLPVDPPITLASDPGSGAPSGDPYVELGWYEDGTYSRLGDGDDLEVVHGIQGGTWTMPTLRTTGIAAFATVDCTMTTETGETVSQIRSKAKFFPKDAYLEILGFPIPVWHLDDPQAPIDDLYGLEATLGCSVSDADGRSASFSLQLVLVSG